MPSFRSTLLYIALAAGLCTFAPSLLAATDQPPANYIPEPELADLIKKAIEGDKATAMKSIESLAAKGPAAERAINFLMFKETTPSARAKYAEILARGNFGRVGYRVTLELQPDGSGSVTLWSDRALLAECGKRFARIMGENEPQYDDDALRQNPFSKAELLKHMGEGVKYLEGRVENKDKRIEATGALSFKGFDAFMAFGDSFDSSGYYMVAGSSLSDRSGIRSLRYRKAKEQDADQFQRNLLLFHNVRWEYILDFKGKLGTNNATQSDGSKLVWSFNCYQMLRGEAIVDASFSSEGLPQRSEPETVAINTTVQAGQPIAVVRNKEVRAKVCNRPAGAPRPSAKELREKGQLVELDGRGSMPQGQALQYQWVQTYGADLNLTADALSKNYVCLMVKEPGEYHFELTVSANGVYSKPVEVKVTVDAEHAPTPKVDPDKVAANPEPPKNPEPVKADPPKADPPKTDPVKPVVADNTTKPTPPEVKNDPPVVKNDPPPAVKNDPPAKKDPPPVVKNDPPAVKNDPPVAPTPPTPPPVAAKKVDPAKAKELYAEGLKQLKAGDYAAAKKTLAEASDYNPDDLDIKEDLGIALMESGENDAAIMRFEEVGQSNSPRRAEAMMNNGHCYVRMNNLDEARNCYRRGTSVGKDAVLWQPLWQLGNKQLAAKDYESALSYLKEAENKAATAKVQDFRLMRDTAIAMQGMGQSAEALKRLDAMQALGYTPDAKLLADVRAGAGKSATPEKKDPPKTEPKVAVTPPVEPKVDPVKADPPNKKDPPESAKPPVAVNEPKEPAKADPSKGEKKPPVVASIPEPRSEKKPKKDPKPAIPKRPLPPIPNDYNDALAAGRKAFDAGEAALKENTDDSRILAAQNFDEAEAMYRGAWKQKPGDPKVVEYFQELTRYVGAIALTQNTYVKARVKGLVVLDAEPSIAPKDKDGNAKPLYYVWEQVDGDETGVRPEDMAKRKVGLRITRPGVYKFDLAVSDGAKGGNPVTVTVEVVE